MKASNLIAKLQALVAEHGDLDVHLATDDHDDGTQPIERFDVIEYPRDQQKLLVVRQFFPRREWETRPRSWLDSYLTNEYENSERGMLILDYAYDHGRVTFVWDESDKENVRYRESTWRGQWP